MIKLPDLSYQSIYDYETWYHLTLKPDRLSKFIAHYEAYKMSMNVPGSIIECGVFKGTWFMRMAALRELLCTDGATKLIGFDVFNDVYPDTKHEEDQKTREFWMSTAGSSSISPEQLSEMMDRQGFKNYELVAGDVLETVPKYAKEHAGLKISLLNVDIDFAEPTYCVLEHFYDRVMPGGIILLDNYAGEDANGNSYHGDTKGVDDFFKDKKVVIRKFPFAARPAYIVKE